MTKAGLGVDQEGSTARTEAPTLKAGRALDALVAEKVMECRILDGWSPSTDIAAAWEVVEKLREREDSIRIETREGPQHNEWWVAIDQFVKDEEWAGGGYYSAEKIFTAQSASLPLAICLASLQAVGV
jgi:hypothetical protein